MSYLHVQHYKILQYELLKRMMLDAALSDTHCYGKSRPYKNGHISSDLNLVMWKLLHPLQLQIRYEAV
jgi:hypothetical protein